MCVVSFFIFMFLFFLFFNQKTAYEMRISDWSSDVCSSDLLLDLARERVWHPYSCPSRCQCRLVPILNLSCYYSDHSRRVVNRYSLSLSGPANQIGRASCRERVCQYV